MPAGRPKKDNDTLQLRASRKLIRIAERMNMNYKKILVEQFEKMICVAILTHRGHTDCGICEEILERKKIIDEEYALLLEEFKQEQIAAVQEEQKMSVVIQQAVIDGKTRGEAESEYGRVFPDHIWKKYSVVKK
jgi:hypothetical protein